MWVPYPLTPLLQTFSDFVLQHLGHPNEAFESTVSNEPFSLGDVVLAVAHKPRSDGATAHGACKRGKLHAARRHTQVVTVHGHQSVAHGKDPREALAATACRHGVVNQDIKIVVIDLLTGGLEHKLVNTLPSSQF